MNTPYDGIGNTFRQGIIAGRRLYGCWLSLANPISTEIIGYSGFDWLLLDGEHSPNDYHSLHMQLLALKDSSSAPVVRPEVNHPVAFKRLLDLGVFNFLVPMVNTVDEAFAAVRATRYPPQGIRGVSVSQRGNHYGVAPDYFDKIHSSICVLAQIESPMGVEHVAEIAAVDGIDGIFVGPQDLAATLGHLRDPGHQEVQDAIRHVVAQTQKVGKPIGTLAPAVVDAKRYFAMGMTFVAVGTDQGFLKESAKKILSSF